MSTSRPPRVSIIVAALLLWSCCSVTAQGEDEAVSNALTAVDIIRLGDPDDDMIVGVAGNDYPTYAEVPNTAFSCTEQGSPGYYADQEAQCQVFHICVTQGRRLEQFSFLCPNGTIFNQQYLVCVWWYEFDCALAPSLYSINANIFGDAGAAPSSRPANFFDGAPGTAASAPRGQPATSRFPGTPTGAGGRPGAAVGPPTATGNQGATGGVPFSSGGLGAPGVLPTSAGRPGLAGRFPAPSSGLDTAGRPGTARETPDGSGAIGQLPITAGRPSTGTGTSSSPEGFGQTGQFPTSLGAPGTTGRFPSSAGTSGGLPSSAGGFPATGRLPTSGGGQSTSGGLSTLAGGPGSTGGFPTSVDGSGTSGGIPSTGAFPSSGTGPGTAGGLPATGRLPASDGGQSAPGGLSTSAGVPGSTGRFPTSEAGSGISGSLPSSGTGRPGTTAGFSTSAGKPSVTGGLPSSPVRDGTTGEFAVPVGRPTSGGSTSSAGRPGTLGGSSTLAGGPGTAGRFPSSADGPGITGGFTTSADKPGTSSTSSALPTRPVTAEGSTFGLSDGLVGGLPSQVVGSNQIGSFPTSSTASGTADGSPSSVRGSDGSVVYSPGSTDGVQTFGGGLDSDRKIPSPLDGTGNVAGQPGSGSDGTGFSTGGSIPSGTSGLSTRPITGEVFQTPEGYPGSSIDSTGGAPIVGSLGASTGIGSGSPGGDAQRGVSQEGITPAGQNIIGQSGQLQDAFGQSGNDLGFSIPGTEQIGSSGPQDLGQFVTGQGQTGLGYPQGQSQGQTGVGFGQDQNAFEREPSLTDYNQVQDGQIDIIQGQVAPGLDQTTLNQGLGGTVQGQSGVSDTQIQDGFGQGQAGLGQEYRGQVTQTVSQPGTGQGQAGLGQGYRGQVTQTVSQPGAGQGQDGLSQGYDSPGQGLKGQSDLTQSIAGLDQAQIGLGQSSLPLGQTGVSQGQGQNILLQDQGAFVPNQGQGQDNFNVGQIDQSQDNEGYSYPAPATSLVPGSGVSSGSGISLQNQENIILTVQSPETQNPTQNNNYQSSNNVLGLGLDGSQGVTDTIDLRVNLGNINNQRPQVTVNSFAANNKEGNEIFVIKDGVQSQHNQDQSISSPGNVVSGSSSSNNGNDFQRQTSISISTGQTSVSSGTGQNSISPSYEFSPPVQPFNTLQSVSQSGNPTFPAVLSNSIGPQNINTFSVNGVSVGNNLVNTNNGVTASAPGGANAGLDISQQRQYDLPSNDFSPIESSISQGSKPSTSQLPQNEIFVANAVPSTGPVSLTNSFKQEAVAPVTQTGTTFTFPGPQTSISAVDLTALQQGYLPPVNEGSQVSGTSPGSSPVFSSPISFPSNSLPSLNLPSSSSITLPSQGTLQSTSSLGSASFPSSNQGSSGGFTSIVSPSLPSPSNSVKGSSLSSSFQGSPPSKPSGSSFSPATGSTFGSQSFTSSLPASPSQSTVDVTNTEISGNTVQNPLPSLEQGYLPPVSDFSRNTRQVSSGEYKVFVTPLPSDDNKQHRGSFQQAFARRSFRPSVLITDEQSTSEFSPKLPSKPFGRVFFPSNRRSDGIPITYVDNSRRSFVATSSSPFNPYNKYSLSWRS